MDILKSSTSTAAALANSEACRDLFAADAGNPDWFDSPVERAVAWAAMRLHGAGKPVDLVTIGKLISETPKVFSAVGGNLVSVVEVVGLHVTDAHFRWHMSELRDDWKSREAKRLLLDEAEISRVDPGSIARKLDELADVSAENSMRDARQACLDFHSRLERDYQLVKEDQIIKTKFHRLDAFTGGLKPEYWVIGARPSTGKTSLAPTLINQLARLDNIPTMFGSIEMPSPAVIQRLVSMLTGFEYNRIPEMAVSPSVQAAISQIAQMPMIIEDGNVTVEALAAKARIAKRRWGIKAIFVDYVQYLTSSEARKKRADRRIEVGEISRRLKGISRDLEIPVIALAQLSREQDKRGSKPKLSDLKESGDLEQDADLVGLLYQSQDDYDVNHDEYGNERDERRLSLEIAKQRNGRTGHIPLKFDAKRMQFSEWK